MLATSCKSDKRISFFVDRESSDGKTVRQLADWPRVVAESDQDRVFADSTSLESYAQYAKLAYSFTLASTEMDDLTDGFSWIALRRFLTTRPVEVLIAGLLVLLFVLPDHLTSVGQILAVPLAPASGLTWRGGRNSHSLPQLVLAFVLAATGVAALVTPLVFRSPYPYLSSILVLAFLGVALILGMDHSRRPQLLNLKIILLRPEYLARYKDAFEARRAWLLDARENAVMPELVQTINRLLGPEQEKRLIVRDTRGLRAVYHPESQVPTRAARRTEDALQRSEGASIALSGPRGCGKTNLLKVLCAYNFRFSVLVSAPTQYAPKEFLIELFQELCRQYLKDQKIPIEGDGAPTKGGTFIRLLRSKPIRFLRIAISFALLGLLVWLVVQASNRQIGQFSELPMTFWTDKRIFSAFILVVLSLLIFPKKGWQFLARSHETDLVQQARGYLQRLQAEQTATLQIGGTLPVMQAAVSRAIASRSLPWTMPELVAHLQRFLAEVAQAMERENRTVLICIDEVDRIGSADEAAKFLSEIKAIFGVPNCYFVVTVAEELGVSFSSRGIAARSVADNAFDEVISLEPMSLDLCREILTRRVPGFTDSFVRLSLVLSGGLPRDLIRAARRLVEIAIESDYELRLPEFAQRIVREEIHEAAIATRSQIAQISPDQEWGPILDRLRQRTEDITPNAKPADLLTALRDIARLPDAFPAARAAETSPVMDALNKLATLALLGLTICDVFSDDCFDIASRHYPTADTPGSFAELAAARRELSISAESCRAAVVRIRLSLSLDPPIN